MGKDDETPGPISRDPIFGWNDQTCVVRVHKNIYDDFVLFHQTVCFFCKLCFYLNLVLRFIHNDT